MNINWLLGSEVGFSSLKQGDVSHLETPFIEDEILRELMMQMRIRH